MKQLNCFIIDPSHGKMEWLGVNSFEIKRIENVSENSSLGTHKHNISQFLIAKIT